jgi:hypothetical protein
MSRSAGQRRGLVPPGGRVPAHRRLPDPRRPDSRTPTHPSGKPVHDCARIPANAGRRPSIGQWPRPGAFSRVPSRRRATRPGLGGRSQGAIPGATGGRYRATQGDAPRQSVQLNALQSDARRRTATHRRCLLSLIAAAIRLRRSSAGVCRPARPQITRNRGCRGGNREIPRMTARSGTQRARGELRMTSVFSCVTRGFKPRARFRFTGCSWWRSLAIEGGSGTQPYRVGQVLVALALLAIFSIGANAPPSRGFILSPSATLRVAAWPRG